MADSQSTRKNSLIDTNATTITQSSLHVQRQLSSVISYCCLCRSCSPVSSQQNSHYMQSQQVQQLSQQSQLQAGEAVEDKLYGPPQTLADMTQGGQCATGYLKNICSHILSPTVRIYVGAVSTRSLYDRLSCLPLLDSNVETWLIHRSGRSSDCRGD